MKSKFTPNVAALFAIVFGLLVTNSTIADETEQTLKTGNSLPAFALKNVDGRVVDSTEFANKPLVVFYFGVECPLVKLYSVRLNELQEELGDDVIWVGINSNQHDSLKEIAQFAKLTKLKMSLLKDPGNKIADDFGASRTPQVFLFDADQKLCYCGAIDDQHSYGQQRASAENDFLLDAINSMIAGKVPETQITEPVGCIIGRIKEVDESSPVTYSKQISRILQSRCVSCHRAGEVAPFSLTDYGEVVGWAEMIQEVVDDRRMPPWHANPEHGDFKNDASLSETELKQIQQWVAAGAPEGNRDELPDPVVYHDGWTIGTPDVVIAMTDEPHPVPATGVIPYKHFVVDPGFNEDKWVQAAECRIGNRAVVHHIIVAVESKNGRRQHGQIPSEWLTATAPGSPPLILPDGYAKLIPAGAKLVFQMHYTPNGTAQTDISSVGLKFADPATVEKSVGTLQAVNDNFRIPAGADNHKVTAQFKFPKDALMLSMFPHMHLRGKSFQYVAKYPDGESEILLDVPNYDFNWQNGYEFKTPKPIPAGTVLECTAHFDNSEDNFANPNPDKVVRWGDQTWDEMMIGYFNAALADQDLTKKQK